MCHNGAISLSIIISSLLKEHNNLESWRTPWLPFSVSFSLVFSFLSFSICFRLPLSFSVFIFSLLFLSVSLSLPHCAAYTQSCMHERTHTCMHTHTHEHWVHYISGFQPLSHQGPPNWHAHLSPGSTIWEDMPGTQPFWFIWGSLIYTVSSLSVFI